MCRESGGAFEFFNNYRGTGAEFFAPGWAELAIDNEQGRAVLQTMRDMIAYMDPDHLTYDANMLQQVYDAGEIAIMNEGGSLASAIIDPKNASAEIIDNTVLAAAPTIDGGSILAAALWWDGSTIAKNISEADAEASFVAMVHGSSPDVVKANANVATWLVKGYERTRPRSA